LVRDELQKVGLRDHRHRHTVARGETLTSIAKLYKVGVEELQKFNHIEDGRRLQAGQTIMIPTSPTPTASPASSTSD